MLILYHLLVNIRTISSGSTWTFIAGRCAVKEIYIALLKRKHLFSWQLLRDQINEKRWHTLISKNISL